jgi:hypothetical protein
LGAQAPNICQGVYEVFLECNTFASFHEGVSEVKLRKFGNIQVQIRNMPIALPAEQI